MSDLDKVMAALRKADEAGNTEDANKLAELARKLSISKVEEPVEEPVEKKLGAMPFANKAIAETVGAPVDLMTKGLNLIPGVDIKKPVGGSEFIKKGMQSVKHGSPDSPVSERESLIQLPEEGQKAETKAQHIGEATGEMASFLFPVGKTALALSKGTGLIGNIAKTVSTAMIKHPYITMTSEVTGGIGTGVGRDVGQEKFPDNPIKQSVAEFGGGIAGGITPTALLNTPSLWALRQGKSLLTKTFLPFTKEGSKYRAGTFLKNQVVDTKKTSAALSEETISELPPVIASGEKKLVGLYKTLVGQDPTTDADTIETLSKSIISLEKEMRKLGYGAPDLLAEISQKRIAAIELGMDTRVVNAMESAQKKLNKLPIANRKVQESRIVRSELKNVMLAEQNSTKELWDKVPKNYKVGVKNTQATYASIIADTPKAQLTDIPQVLKKSFIFNDDITKTSIKEMQGLRAKLLESARKAQKDGDWNKARISRDVADSILEDIGVNAKSDITPEASDLKAAIAATKKFKQRFEQGTVGKLLGYGQQGAPAIDPDITLDMSIGRMKQKGSLDIEKIAVTPQAVEATKRYLGRSYTDYALDKKTGRINPLKSEEWISNNEAILDKFPGMQNQLSDVGGAQKFANNTKLRMDSRKKALQDPNISVSARFINAANMDIAVHSVLKSPNPAKMSAELVRQANQDQTGKALVGLRGGFVDYFLEKASIGAFNNFGEQTLSGRTLLSLLNKNSKSIYHVFKPEQIQRMRRVATELVRIESFEKSTAGKIDINMSDLPSTALSTISRIGGAQLGRMIAGVTGGGTVQTPGIVSGHFQKIASFLSKDRASQLIHDAIISENPDLLKSLLLPINKPGGKAIEKNISILHKQLNFWLSDTGRRVLNNINSEELGEK